jgi:AcrR family transcriptional regulator
VRERAVKREAVIRAAAHAFNRKGYHNTSLDDIAAALDVTKPTVYYYVTSKEQLLFECFVAGVEQIRTAFRAVKQLEVPARERLNGVLRHYGEAVASEFGWCMVRAEEQDLPPAMSSHIKALKSEIDQGIRRLIREGIQDGSIHPCDPKMTAFALAGALNWIAHWYRENQSMTGAEIAGAFVTIFESGLRPREAGVAAPGRGDARRTGSRQRAASRRTPRETGPSSPEPRQVGSSQIRQRSTVTRPGASHPTASPQATPRQTRPRSAATRQAGPRPAATRAGR